MAARNHRHVLEDIENAIVEIERAIRDRTFQDFQASWVLMHAVQRGIEIISEAARHLPSQLTATRPEIP